MGDMTLMVEMDPMAVRATLVTVAQIPTVESNPMVCPRAVMSVGATTITAVNGIANGIDTMIIIVSVIMTGITGATEIPVIIETCVNSGIQGI